MFIGTLLVLSSIAALLLFARTYVTMRRYSQFRPTGLKNQDIPSVSVCIAARNETHALAQCLERVLKSDYPKLEVLVLDDSSTDSTSLIIKSFASAGVRFIAGSPLPDGWLGKNHAYRTLIDEASADYVLFLDVDTSIRINTIAQLVAYIQHSRVSMISVLPKREDSYRFSAVFGTLRYYWELLLGTHNRPPVASALWMAERSVLLSEQGSLRTLGSSIRFERGLAHALHRTSGYRYVLGTSLLGVSFAKRLSSQWETAARLYYPMTGRSVTNWLLAQSFLLLLIVPLLIVISWQWSQIELFWSLGLIGLTGVTIQSYVRVTHGRIAREWRMLGWPVLLMQEMILLTLSLVRHRFGIVTWKGRAVKAQSTKHDALRLNE